MVAVEMAAAAVSSEDMAVTVVVVEDLVEMVVAATDLAMAAAAKERAEEPSTSLIVPRPARTARGLAAPTPFVGLQSAAATRG